MAKAQSDRLHQAFEIGIMLKALDGVLEIIGGLLLLFISPATITALAKVLTQHELSGDPHDFVANHILHSASSLTHSGTLFGAVYLLLHGLVKIVLVIAVGRDQLWAFPWMIGFIGLFALYQIYRIVVDPTIGLIALTLFDAVIIWLTAVEWRTRLAKAKSAELGRPAQ